MGDGSGVTAIFGGEGGIIRVSVPDDSQVGGGFTTFMGGPCGPRVGAVGDPLIMVTGLVGWTMRLFWER